MYIVVDGNFMSYVSHSSFGELGYEGEDGWVPTGVVYGFFKNLLTLNSDKFWERFGETCSGGRFFVVGWDRKPEFRLSVSGEYKANRGKMERDEKLNMRLQMKEVVNMLSLLGVNQCWAEGMECDDVMATIVRKLRGRGKVVLVANDNDLFQLLDKKVLMCNLSQLYTKIWFEKKHGIPPKRWVEVKTIAGCSTDGVKGVPGVGLKSALRMIREHGSVEGVLACDSGGTYVRRVREFGPERLAQVRSLVELRSDVPLCWREARRDLGRLMSVFRRKRMRSFYAYPMLFENFETFIV